VVINGDVECSKGAASLGGSAAEVSQLGPKVASPTALFCILQMKDVHF